MNYREIRDVERNIERAVSSMKNFLFRKDFEKAVRQHDEEIELREPVLNPDLLIIQDPTLFQAIDVFSGLKPDGYVLINSTRSAQDLGIADAVAGLPDGHTVVVPATELALEHIHRLAVPAGLREDGVAVVEPFTVGRDRRLVSTRRVPLSEPQD